MSKKGDYVRLRKKPDSSMGLITETTGDYIRIFFADRKPAKIRKRDFDQFYLVVEPREGFTLDPTMKKKSVGKKKSTLSKAARTATSSKPKRRKAVSSPVVEDPMEIRPGQIIRVPNQNWGMGVITKIKDDQARIVFLDHYTKLIPLEIISRYFIPIEQSRYIPEDLTDSDGWADLHRRNQTKFDPRYDPWNVGMFASTGSQKRPKE